MKSILHLSTILLLACSMAMTARAADSSGPADVVAAFHDALESGNAERALSLLSPDVIIYESGGVEASRKEYASHHLGADIEFLKTVETRIVDQTSGTDGEHGWVLTRSETSGTYRGKPIDLAGTETIILERVADGWKIVHVHWSSHSKSAGH